jgi:hypothetical protein
MAGLGELGRVSVIFVGILLLIWSLLKQGVSVLGLGLLMVGFLLLVIASFLQ